MKTLFILILVVFHCVVFAQKDEYERRVNQGEVPIRALNWVENIESSIKHPKWFAETTSGMKSFEIKFVSAGRIFSIEFDTTGTVEDVEILMKKKHIESSIKDRMYAELKQKFERSKFVKIQL
jgi:hypothetical protein